MRWPLAEIGKEYGQGPAALPSDVVHSVGSTRGNLPSPSPPSDWSVRRASVLLSEMGPWPRRNALDDDNEESSVVEPMARGRRCDRPSRGPPPDAEREARAFDLLDDEERARWHRFLAVGARRQFVLWPCCASSRPLGAVGLPESSALLRLSRTRQAFRHGARPACRCRFQRQPQRRSWPHRDRGP